MERRTGAWRRTGILVCLLGASFASFAQSSPQADSKTAAPSSPQTQATSPPARQPLTLEERGDIFMARKAYADAVDYYYRALKQIGPSTRESAVIWNKLGIAYQQVSDFDSSRKAYNAAIKRKPDFPEPWNNLGTTFYMENKAKKSIKYYRRAVNLNPKSAPFHLNLGTAYDRTKNYKKALEEYRTALTIDPDVLTERSDVGTILQAPGVDAKFYFYLAKAFASVGRADEAVRYLRHALEEGYKDKKKIASDPDLKKISNDPAFIELLKNPPVPIN